MSPLRDAGVRPPGHGRADSAEAGQRNGPAVMGRQKKRGRVQGGFRGFLTHLVNKLLTQLIILVPENSGIRRSRQRSVSVAKGRVGVRPAGAVGTGAPRGPMDGLGALHGTVIPTREDPRVTPGNIRQRPEISPFPETLRGLAPRRASPWRRPPARGGAGPGALAYSGL